MKVKIKKIGMVFSVFIIVLICLFFAGMAYLYLFPKAELFGIVHASDKSSKMYGMRVLEPEQVSQVKLSTKQYDIDVVADESFDNIRAYVDNDMSGYCKKTNSICDFTYRFDSTSGVLTMETVEMSGWVGAGKSKVKLTIPKRLWTSSLSVLVSTSKSSNINVIGTGESELNKLTIRANRGDVYFNSVKLNELCVDCYKSDVVAGEKVTGDLEVVTLDVGNSRVDFMKAGGISEIIKQDTPDLNQIKFNINKLYINDARRKSAIYVYKCAELLTESGCVVSSGKLEIFSVGYMNFKSKDFNVLIKDFIDGGIGNSSFVATGSAKIEVINCGTKLSATTKSGGIKIDNPTDALVLESGTGDIIVKNARKEIAVVSEYGNIDIRFADDVPQFTTSEKTRYISSLRTKHGSVNIFGVNNINLNLDEGADCNINIYYNKVVGINILNSKSGNLKVVVPKDENVKLNVECEESIVEISVGTATKEKGQWTGIYQCEVYGTAGQNILNVQSCGQCYLYSSDIYGQI